MPTQFEHIIAGFVQGSSTLEATCATLAREAQSDASRTRFWGQRIETAMKRGHIAPPAARAMLDALEGFQCDKTMWLDPSQGVPHPAASAPPKSSPPIIETAEQLRATLFAPIARPRRADTVPPALRDAHAANVEWVEPARPSRTSIEDELPLGTVLNDRFELVSHLGVGGVGQMFDAIDRAATLETHVTLKIVAVNLQRSPYAFDALAAAVRQSQHLDHPNIVRVHDVGHDGERVFITMERLVGRWLSGMVREVRHKGMSYEQAWPIIAGIANGLAHAHARGIVHSDLSPHAVFVCADGSAKILGFGLGRALPESNESLDVLDTLTLRAYTEAYTADAWAQQGEPHPADDLYPLGVIAYEMLTGVHPFARCSLSVARQKGLTCAPIDGLNRRARKLIERCLSFERAIRPKDGRSFVKRMRPGVIERLWLTGGANA